MVRASRIVLVRGFVVLAAASSTAAGASGSPVVEAGGAHPVPDPRWLELASTYDAACSASDADPAKYVQCIAMHVDASVSAPAHATDATCVLASLVTDDALGLANCRFVAQHLGRTAFDAVAAGASPAEAETAARGQANALKIQAEADAEQSRISAKAHADGEIIKARGIAEAEKVKAEGDKIAMQMRAEGEADGIRALATAISSQGGTEAMSQRIAEQYVTNLGKMSQSSNMIIVPDRPNDLAGVVTTALTIGDTIKQGTAAAKPKVKQAWPDGEARSAAFA